MPRSTRAFPLGLVLSCLAACVCVYAGTDFNGSLRFPGAVTTQFPDVRTSALPSSLVTDGGNRPLKLQMMEEAATKDGAVCIDGTAAGYYIDVVSGATSWMVYFEGGGWCYKESDCAQRAQGDLGSSNGWKPYLSAGGLVSSDCSVNPEFCNFNRVYLKYCDGASFSGNRDDPVDFNGANLFFRGRRIIDAVFADLRARYNFAAATDVLLTGCSAGGLATYLHADYVQTLLPESTKNYRAAAISGLFALDTNAVGEPVYPDEMRTIYQLANSTNGVNDACVAAQKAGEEWHCIFAPVVFDFIKTPFMVLNSLHDSWQTMCILSSEPVPADNPSNGLCGATPGWLDCTKDIGECDVPRLQSMNKFAASLQSVLETSPKLQTAGNSAHVNSCYMHCEANYDAGFVNIRADGVTIRDAVSKWWRAPLEGKGAANTTYLPCEWNTTPGSPQCEKTCPV